MSNNKLNITKKLISKYTKMTLKVIKFYGIPSYAYDYKAIPSLDNILICYIDISFLGYNKDDNKDTTDEVEFLTKEGYLLLIPFYTFYRYFNKLENEYFEINEEVFNKMNENMKFINGVKKLYEKEIKH